ncbi:homeodomain mating type protein alpha2 [Coniothyrium glycines]
MSAIVDNMDEFFDFARLDNDDELPTPNLEPQSIAACSFDDVITMDWCPDQLTTVRPTDPLWAHSDSEPGIDARSTIEWPLLNATSQLVSSNLVAEAGLADISSWNGNDHVLDVSISPHMSSMPPGEAVGLMGSIDEEGSIATVESPDHRTLPVDQSNPDTFTAITAKSDSGRPDPSKRVRNASTTSWKPASAKRKGPQSRISLEARQILEDEFAANPYPCSWEMDIIAHQANLDVKKVRNWFNNTRARKKGDDAQSFTQDHTVGSSRSLKPKLSRDSLEALDKHANDASHAPQPPLAVYLAQSYQEEAIDYSAVQAAIDSSSTRSSVLGREEVWSKAPRERTGSVVTASSDCTAPTTYTVSSSGSRSNISSFGRDRRRGRRRIAWKESPRGRQSINGVNSAGEPQKDLPFFCTFCPRAFKTKYEWIRHEDSVHALRTTWICCDTRSACLESCPFCAQSHPDDAHMAGHKFQQCRSKPESQRTFYRRDHFVQHLHHVHFAGVKHPSVRVGCSARLMASEGQNFGCKELAMKWRRFGAPSKQDDPLLHCGFCGKRSKDWSERCEHIAEHLIARELDRSVWWGERKENHLENLYSALPYESFRCRYCLMVFTDTKSMNEHSHCRVWSCRFLRNFDDVTADNAGPPLCPDFPSAKAHHCHLCGAGYRTPHVEHAQNYHRYRSCNQEFYTSEESFLQHLHNFHGASQPALLEGHSAIEQSYMRNKGASFEPVEFNESWQPCLIDLDINPMGPFMPSTVSPKDEKKDQTQSKRQSQTRKKSHDERHQTLANTNKAQRQRTNTALSKTESLGPRFFRLNTYVPILSSRIFYSHNSKTLGLPRDDKAVIEEMPRPHIASLVMSAGLVGLASVRLAIKPEKHIMSGFMELKLDEDDEV